MEPSLRQADTVKYSVELMRNDCPIQWASIFARSSNTAGSWSGPRGTLTRRSRADGHVSINDRDRRTGSDSGGAEEPDAPNSR